MKTLVERFLEGVDKSEDCWNWKKSKDKNGYGYIKKNGKTHKAHRISYELFCKPITEGLWVLHRCDNPARYTDI